MKKKKFLKLMLEIEKEKLAVFEKNCQNQDNQKGDSGMSTEILLKQIEGQLSRFINDNVELSKALKSMMHSHKLLLDKFNSVSKELDALKKVVKEGFDNINYYEEPKVTCENVTVFTDASCSEESGLATYGIVVLPDDGSVNEYSGPVVKPEGVDKICSQVGETYAIVKALELMRDQEYKNVLLYTDCISARDWSEMGNKSNNPCAQWFYSRIKELENDLNITIMWMKRCSCEYNTRADALARLSLTQSNFLYLEQKLNNSEDDVA